MSSRVQRAIRETPGGIWLYVVSGDRVWPIWVWYETRCFYMPNTGRLAKTSKNYKLFTSFDELTAYLQIQGALFHGPKIEVPS